MTDRHLPSPNFLVALPKLKSSYACLFLLLGLTLIGTATYAQTVITGKVVDENNESMPGVNVLVKATTIGTVTDIDGNYQLSVPDDAEILVFSSVGYLTEEITIDGQSTIDLNLLPDTQSLSEVVVVGYGTQQQRDVTGAISSVKGEEIAKLPVQSVAAALQGQAAGVEVTAAGGAPGQGATVRIRGTSSANANSNPLYVIDGIPGGDIATVNTWDVESIEVLKDASAAAIYGSRAADGVIIVTTKKGSQGKLSINFDGFYGFQRAARTVDLLNVQQFADLIEETNLNGGTPVPTRVQDIRENPEAYGQGTDWQDEVFRTAPMQKYYLSLAGGGENHNFFISGGYENQQGILIYSDYENYTLRANTSLKAGKFTFGESIGLSYSQARPESAPGIFSILQRAMIVSPAVPVYDPDNEGGFAGPELEDDSDFDNPVGTAALTIRNNQNLRFNGIVYGEYEFLPGLKYRLNLSAAINNGHDLQHTPSYEMGVRIVQPFSSVTESSSLFISPKIENLLMYDRTFGKHKVDLLLGYTEERFRTRSFSATGEELPDRSIDVLGAVTGNVALDGEMQNIALRSLLVRMNYSFADKYLITANVRRDGSSKFSPNNRYGVFPSISAGWRLIEESFLQNQSWLSDLKLRAGYGQLGNQSPLGNYPTATALNFNANYFFPDVGVATGAVQTSFANPNVQWEVITTSNVGIDASFLEGRLSFTTDYFERKTDDMLINVPVPPSVGLGSTTLNAGSLRNRGFEFLIQYRNQVNDFRYNLSANFTTVDNEILSLGDGEPINSGVENWGGTRTEVGSPIGAFYGFVVDGIYQNAAEINPEFAPGAAPGDIRFKDLDGDNVLTSDDQRYIGTPFPDFTYGVNANLAWKGLDLYMQWYGSQGNDILNAVRRRSEGFNRNGNATTRALDRWQQEGDITDVPRAVAADPNNNARVSTRFIEDGSFLRLRNLTLGYSLPLPWLESVNLSSVRVYLTGQNLLTFTEYTGHDPEVGNVRGTQGNENLSRGIDNGIYPVARSIIFGLQVGF